MFAPSVQFIIRVSFVYVLTFKILKRFSYKNIVVVNVTPSSILITLCIV